MKNIPSSNETPLKKEDDERKFGKTALLQRMGFLNNVSSPTDKPNTLNNILIIDGGDVTINTSMQKPTPSGS